MFCTFSLIINMILATFTLVAFDQGVLDLDLELCFLHQQHVKVCVLGDLAKKVSIDSSSTQSALH